jgi:uncharacterized protein YbjQ (UPF0145 family)
LIDEGAVLDSTRARRAFRILIKLVANGAFMPYSLFAREAYRLLDQQPRFFGGFSDVYHACSETGQEVALKRLRLNARGKSRENIIGVRVLQTKRPRLLI